MANERIPRRKPAPLTPMAVLDVGNSADWRRATIQGTGPAQAKAATTRQAVRPSAVPRRTTLLGTGHMGAGNAALRLDSSAEELDDPVSGIHERDTVPDSSQSIPAWNQRPAWGQPPAGPASYRPEPPPSSLARRTWELEVFIAIAVSVAVLFVWVLW